MNDRLGEIEEHFGPPPRRIGLIRRWSLRTRPPYWLAPSDGLREVYRRQDFLLRQGEVVWGVIVQANHLVYRDGLGDHPAVAIYSTDRIFRGDPGRLRNVTGRLHALRSTTPSDPAERRYAAILSDEQNRELDVPVPRTCTGGREVISTTIMVRRKHLPRGRLENDSFPLLVHSDTPATLILPSRFWPERYTREWLGEQ